MLAIQTKDWTGGKQSRSLGVRKVFPTIMTAHIEVEMRRYLDAGTARFATGWSAAGTPTGRERLP